MNATKLLLAAALFTGLATLSFAGPGPQFWAQQTKNQPAQPAKADTQAKAEPAAEVTACATCAGCHCTSMKKS